MELKLEITIDAQIAEDELEDFRAAMVERIEKAVWSPRSKVKEVIDAEETAY